MDKSNSKQIRKLLIIVVAIIGVAWLSYTAFQSMVASKRGTLVIESVPSDLALTANGKRISANGKQTFQPGTYKFEAKRAGFNDIQKEVVIKKGETQKVFMYLDPNGEAGEKWLSDHPQEAIKREGLKGAEHKEEVKKAVEKNDFIRQLPYIGPAFMFRIDYGAPEADNKYPDQPTIFIQGATSDAHQLALEWMRSHGYDPDTMNIVLQLKQPE